MTESPPSRPEDPADDPQGAAELVCPDEGVTGLVDPDDPEGVTGLVCHGGASAVAVDSGSGSLVGQIGSVDRAIYAAVATTPTPVLDRRLAELSRMADDGKLWFGVAGALAVVGGVRGRRAAVDGLCSLAIASALANLIVKPVAERERPDLLGGDVPMGRRVEMPSSLSFPSGHTASAFAFAVGATRSAPVLAGPLLLLAAAVGYSRVHTGVHFPLDVVSGALLGGTVGQATSSALAWTRRHLPSRRRSS